MQSLDQNMARLVEMGLVSYEEAKARAKDQGEFERLINLTPSSSSKSGKPPTSGNPPGVQSGPQQPPGVRGAQFRPGYQSK